MANFLEEMYSKNFKYIEFLHTKPKLFFSQRGVLLWGFWITHSKGKLVKRENFMMLSHRPK